MRFIFEKSTVLIFVALKIIVFSALIFVITGCQPTSDDKLGSNSTPKASALTTAPTNQTEEPYTPSASPIASIGISTTSSNVSPTVTPTPLPVTNGPDPTLTETPPIDSKNGIDNREINSPIPPAINEEVKVLCSLDSERQEISCHISGAESGQHVKWTSNATSRWKMGPEWHFSLGESQFQNITEIFVEICENSVCTKIQTELDTSHLVEGGMLDGVTQNDEKSVKTSPDKPVNSSDSSQENIYNPLASQEVIDRYPVWAKYCTGSGPVMFSFSPMRLEDMNMMSPYGDVVGGHITPIDHMYFSPKDESLGRDIYEVRAIQDGLIYDVNVRDKSTETNEAQARDWRLDIGHTCTFASYFDLLTSVTSDIEEKWAESLGKGNHVDWEGIEIKAGQLIGYVGGQSLDFGVYDWDVTLPGLINPEAYAGREPWKIHTVDPFQYFPTEIRETLLDKMIREVEPRAGKIDYDVDGTLSGNWFEEGTDWYNGVNQSKYWEGHLSIAPHQIDPTLWRIGLGFLETNNNNFVIQGDSDPLDISVDSGPVSYTLKSYKVYIPGDPEKQWWTEPHVKGEVYGVLVFPDLVGTVLLSLEENDLLRLEVFMGKSKDQVEDFTPNARLYVR